MDILFGMKLMKSCNSFFFITSIVYVDMGMAYNNPVTLTVVSSGSTSSTRSFSIKVTQIECSSLNRGELKLLEVNTVKEVT